MEQEHDTRPSDDDSSGHNGSLAALSLAAIGVVYGDIGTSPLYAIRESINEYDAIHPLATGDILGILSLVFWSLVIVIAFKYVGLVMQADNEGEGGIIALTALISPPDDEAPRGSRRWGSCCWGSSGPPSCGATA